MIMKLGKYYIFYRHMLYGSALVIGTIIGTQGHISSIIAYIFLTIGTLLMANSVFVSCIINTYPEEFEKEMEKEARDEQSSKNL